MRQTVQPFTGPGASVSECLKTYLDGRITPKAVAKKRALYAIAHLRLGFAEREMRSVDQAAVESYRAKRRAGLVGKPAGDATARRELGVLIAAANWAARRAKILPLADVPVLDLPPSAEPKSEWLDDEETVRLFQAAQGDEARLTRASRFVALGRYTAARCHSIETLQWGQVDLEAGLIDFRGGPITKKRKGIVPISAALRIVLERAWNERCGYYVLDSPGSIRTAFNTAKKRAGLPHITPHTLRHTWATRALQEGVSIWDVAGVLCDSVETVRRVYGHHCPDHLRGAVEAGSGKRYAEVWSTPVGR
jgi:integrase